MTVYARFKKNPEGFRQLVELLESTPSSRRQKMIDVGMAEDPVYTEAALKYVMTFEDVLQFSEMELAELMAKAPARSTAFAIKNCDEATRTRFLKCSKPVVAAEIRDFMETNIGLREVGGAQLKLVECARKLEKAGYIKSKRIPDKL